MSEQRIEIIESKLAFQEDLIETLNSTVYQQQKKLEQLEATCAMLARHIASLAESAKDGQPAHEKPPHY